MRARALATRADLVVVEKPRPVPGQAIFVDVLPRDKRHALEPHLLRQLLGKQTELLPPTIVPDDVEALGFALFSTNRNKHHIDILTRAEDQ